METSTGPVQQAQLATGLSNPASVQQQPAGSPPTKKPAKKRIRIQTEKRKEQNRSNQRAFRQRRERYVKDLEVSHHNLRHLVSHQGGEIEALKARLVDLSGGKEGAEPSPTAKAAALAREPFDFESQYGSGSEEHPSVKSEGSDSGADEALLSPCVSQKLDTIVEAPSQVQSVPSQAPASLSTSMPIPMPRPPLDIMAPVPIPSMQQYWSTPDTQPLALSSSNTTISSMGSSWSQSYTPPTPSSSTFDSGEHFQPFLAGETAPTAPSIAWPADTVSHVMKDESGWLQQGVQSTQYCLPYQDVNHVPSFAAYDFSGDSMDPSKLGNWQTSNALGLDNLFPNLNTFDKKPLVASPLQLLGRPLTPFASFVSPSTEYGYAT